MTHLNLRRVKANWWQQKVLKEVEVWLPPISDRSNKRWLAYIEGFLTFRAIFLYASSFFSHLRSVITLSLQMPIKTYIVVTTGRSWMHCSFFLASAIDMAQAKTLPLPQEYSSSLTKVNSFNSFDAALQDGWRIFWITDVRQTFPLMGSARMKSTLVARKVFLITFVLITLLRMSTFGRVARASE